ncbi:MAG: hypothetical protein Fur0042_14750 [Cyanophyceae cyanobacterium]
MDSDEKFSSLDIDEVVSVHEDFRLCFDNQTFTVREFCTQIGAILGNYYKFSSAAYRIFWDADQCAWFDGEGVPCNVLRFGDRAWQSGRVRLTLEFCPDPPEEEALDVPLLPGTMEDSPLDEIRRLSNE